MNCCAFVLIIRIPNEVQCIWAYYMCFKWIVVYLRLLYVVQINCGVFTRIIRVSNKLRRVCAYYTCSKWIPVFRGGFPLIIVDSADRGPFRAYNYWCFWMLEQNNSGFYCIWMRDTNLRLYLLWFLKHGVQKRWHFRVLMKIDSGHKFALTIVDSPEMWSNDK